MRTMTVKGEVFEVVTGAKKAEWLVSNYESRYAVGSLNEAYKVPSTAKREIEEYWIRFMGEVRGFNYKVTSWNTFSFSLAFTVNHPEYGGIYYITPNHNYFIPESVCDKVYGF